MLDWSGKEQTHARSEGGGGGGGGGTAVAMVAAN